MAESDDTDGEPASPPTLGDLLDDLEALRNAVDTQAERDRVQAAIETAYDVEEPAVFGRVVVGFDRSDVAEALLGSLVFGIPMVVEGGTLEVGQFVAGHPLYFLATFALAIGITVGILYVADFQDVRITRRYFGLVPRRLVGVTATSFLTALALMTVWGRVDWGTPWLALAQVTVAFVPMVIGASLGDILPG